MAKISPEIKELETSILTTSINNVTDANYTILDSDGYELILVSTGASNRTVTLPTAANNNGRRISIKKTDAGTGWLLVTGGTIEGVATAYIPQQYDFIDVVCDGTNWQLVNSFFSPLTLTNQNTGPSITNAVYVDFGTGTLTVPPGKYLVSVSGTMFSYFNSQPTWATAAVRLSPLVDGFVTADDGTNILKGEGMSQGQTGGGGNRWAQDVNIPEKIKTISTTETFKLQGYYKDAGGTEVGGLGRQCSDGAMIWKKIGL